MKMKKLLVVCAFVSMSFIAKAGVFADAIKDWATEVEDVYPYAAAIAFVVLGLFNYEHFFGKQPDYKKGVVNLAWFIGINAILIGGYQYITSSSL